MFASADLSAALTCLLARLRTVPLKLHWILGKQPQMSVADFYLFIYFLYLFIYLFVLPGHILCSQSSGVHVQRHFESTAAALQAARSKLQVYVSAFDLLKCRQSAVFFVSFFLSSRHRAVVLQHEDDFCYLSFSPSFCLAMFPSCCHLSISKCDSCLAPKQTAALSCRMWAFFTNVGFFYFFFFNFFPCGVAFNPHTHKPTPALRRLYLFGKLLLCFVS